jgi:UDP-N-acetylmuramoylalanine--D-glutamate ligase
MGVDNSKILTYFDGKVDLYDTHSIQEAVNKCREVASPGDTILLSPCCASFDLFKSYEDRGEQFKATVKGLK